MPSKSFTRRQRRADRRITVSFDLDDTLTSHSDRVPMERGFLPRFVYRWLGEPLRQGTTALMRELRRRGCSVWIYTSSGRSPFHIRRWLLLHGIFVDGVVNSERHRQSQSPQSLDAMPVPETPERMPSKFPPAFGIDLHVDDSEGVRMEGAQHGFRVVVVNPEDERWGDKVLEAVKRLQRARARLRRR